jgi:hypothetical protein
MIWTLGNVFFESPDQSRVVIDFVVRHYFWTMYNSCLCDDFLHCLSVAWTSVMFLRRLALVRPLLNFTRSFFFIMARISVFNVLATIRRWRGVFHDCFV